jgi:hypothetical protein
MAYRLHAAHMLCSVGEQSHKASLFDRATQAALMLGTGASFAAWFDFPAIRDVTFHVTIGIFIVNFAYMIMAELTNFAASAALTTTFTSWTWGGAGSASTPFRTSLHHRLTPSLGLEGVIV